MAEEEGGVALYLNIFVCCRLLKDKERYERLAKQEILLVERQKERKMVDTASNSREFMVLTVSRIVLGFSG